MASHRKPLGGDECKRLIRAIKWSLTGLDGVGSVLERKGWGFAADVVISTNGERFRLKKNSFGVSALVDSNLPPDT